MGQKQGSVLFRKFNGVLPLPVPPQLLVPWNECVNVKAFTTVQVDGGICELKLGLKQNIPLV